MKTIFIFVLLVAFAAASVVCAKDSDRFVQKLKLPSGQVVVVAEGDFEARSIGSYSARLYSGANPKYPTDDFLNGVVRERDGSLEKALLADVNGDGKKELVVVARCVGTGSYLSADAFAFRGKTMVLLASAEGLPANVDPVASIMKRLVWNKTHKTPWPGTTEWLNVVDKKVQVSDKDGHGPDIGSREWFETVDAKLQVSDAQGHGPDLGSDEWVHAVHRKVFREEPPDSGKS